MAESDYVKKKIVDAAYWIIIGLFATGIALKILGTTVYGLLGLVF